MTQRSSKRLNWIRKKAKKLILQRKLILVSLILTFAAKLILVIPSKNISTVTHNMIPAAATKSHRRPKTRPVYCAKAPRNLETTNFLRWKKWIRQRRKPIKINANTEK